MQKTSMARSGHTDLKYNRLAEQLKNQYFVPGGLPADRKLPTEDELSRIYFVSRKTIRNALQILEAEGYIYRRRGSGTYSTGKGTGTAANRVAVLVPSDNLYRDPSLNQRLRAGLTAAHYVPEFYSVGTSPAAERTILLRLTEDPPLGLVTVTFCSALPTPNDDLYRSLAAAGVNILFLGYPYPNMLNFCRSIHPDYTAGGRMAADHLLSLRRHDLAFLGEADTAEAGAIRLGIQKSLIYAGLPLSRLHDCLYTAEDWNRLQIDRNSDFLRRFAETLRETSNGVICQNDSAAYWLLHEIQSLGFRVPYDIAVFSFDNSYLCDLSRPTITSAGTSADLMTGLIVRFLKGRDPGTAQLTWTLHTRESTTVLRR